MTNHTELLARLDKDDWDVGDAALCSSIIRDLTAQLEVERQARERVEATHKGLMQEQDRRTEEAERDARTAHSLKDIALELKEAAEAKLAAQLLALQAANSGNVLLQAKLAAVEAETIERCAKVCEEEVKEEYGAYAARCIRALNEPAASQDLRSTTADPVSDSPTLAHAAAPLTQLKGGDCHEPRTCTEPIQTGTNAVTGGAHLDNAHDKYEDYHPKELVATTSLNIGNTPAPASFFSPAVDTFNTAKDIYHCQKCNAEIKVPAPTLGQFDQDEINARAEADRIKKTLCDKINASPSLQSLLYDIDLMPEQIKPDDLRRWGYVESIVGHFEAARLEGMAIAAEIAVEQVTATGAANFIRAEIERRKG